MRVKWIPEAKNSLFEVTTYIRENNPKAAKRVISHIRRTTSSLSQNPYLAPMSTKFPRYRELIITRYPFVIWYQVKEEQQLIEIRLVWHAAQDRNQGISD
ncbi:type II toxin-antitoxin system RelE/ParE family toxin [Magnetococcales bacterium HHB-1]